MNFILHRPSLRIIRTALPNASSGVGSAKYALALRSHAWFTPYYPVGETFDSNAAMGVPK